MKNLLIISVAIYSCMLSACETREVAPVYESQAAFQLRNLVFDEKLHLKAAGEEVLDGTNRFSVRDFVPPDNAGESILLSKTIGYRVPADSTRNHYEYLELTFSHKEDRSHLSFIDNQRALYRRPEDLRQRFFSDPNTDVRITFWQTYLLAKTDVPLQGNQRFDLTRVTFLKDTHGVYLEADMDATLKPYWEELNPIFTIQGTLTASFNDTLYVVTSQ